METIKQHRTQLTSPETSQKITNILWNEPYHINFLQKFGTHTVAHSFQNKAIQLAECTSSKPLVVDLKFYIR